MNFFWQDEDPAAKKARSYSDIERELMADSGLMAHWSNTDKWVNEAAGYDEALADAKEQRLRDYGGVFQMHGEEDLFTKITEGMYKAGEKETYQPFFETKRQTAEDATINIMNQAGYTKGGQVRGFADSSASGSFMDEIMSNFGTKVVDYIGQMEQSASAGQRRIEEIIRNNQAQAQYLKELERG